MIKDTKNQDLVTEDEKELSTKIEELDNKKDKSEDEIQELKGLKEERHSSFNKRLGEFNYRAKSAEEREAVIADENEKLKAHIKDLESKPKPDDKPVINNDTVKYNEQPFFTDAALNSKVKAGEMTEGEAMAHQSERISAKAADDAYKRIKKETTQEENLKIVDADVAGVIKKYPHFAKKLPDGTLNPEHNPNDPLYKKVIEIWQDGYNNNPHGFSKAVAIAEQLMGKNDINPDLSKEHNLYSPSAPEGKDKDQEVKFTAEEEDIAIKMYRDQVNPKTGRNYTATEAIAKSKSAKKNRGYK